MARLFGTSTIPAEANRQVIQPILSPIVYPWVGNNIVGGWPSSNVGGAMPNPRKVLLTFQLGWIEAGVPIRSLLIPHGNLAVVGQNAHKVKAALFAMDSLYYTGAASGRGMHEALLHENCKMSAGVSVANAKTAGGGANARVYKFAFDGEYVPFQSQPVMLATAFELLYSATAGPDTLPTACLASALSDGANGGVMRWQSEMSTAGSYVGRNYFYNTLIAGGIDAIDFNAYADPAIASYAVSGAATATVSGETITLNYCMNLGWFLSAQ